jgi:phosphoglycolate phosphatase-like HAD superfamily hydrolase
MVAGKLPGCEGTVVIAAVGSRDPDRPESGNFNELGTERHIQHEEPVKKRIDTLRAIAFDFDGVILESADIKTAAFMALYAAFPEHLAAIRGYHLGNAGISRYVKFEYIQTKILGLPYTERDREQQSAEFARLTHEQILRCPEVKGAAALLRGLEGRVLRIVASGTPQDELKKIVAERGMGTWFDEVWGTPRTKPEILRDVLASHGLAAGAVLMVGDGMSDYQSAQETGVRFLARETDSVFAGMAVDTVRDLDEMRAWLEKADDRP